MTVRRHPAIATLVGLANVGVVFYSAFVEQFVLDPTFRAAVLSPQAMWTDALLYLVVAGSGATAAFWLAAGPVYGLLRFRLILPLFVGGLPTYFVVADGSEAIYDFLWTYFFPPFAPFALTVLVAVTVLEFGVRAWTGIAEPKPLL